MHLWSYDLTALYKSIIIIIIIIFIIIIIIVNQTWYALLTHSWEFAQLCCKYNVHVALCCSGAILAAICNDFSRVIFSQQ